MLPVTDIAETVGERTYRRLRSDIIFGRLQPGQRLRLERLSAQYETSIATLRELLNRLLVEGLIVAEGQRGFEVTPVSADRWHEIAQMRELLECHALRQSIDNGDVEWEGRVVAAHHKLAHIENRLRAWPKIEPTHLGVWCEAEWEFHETLISACGSGAMHEMHRKVYDRHRQHNLALSSNYSFRDENIIEHKAILDAAMARDPDLCSGNIEIHLRRGLDAVLGGRKSGKRAEGQSVDGETA